MLSLFKVFMSQDVIQPTIDTIMSGFITQGPRVEEFEEKLQTMFNYPYILTLNSATSGLTLALRLIKDRLSLTSSSEVLCTPLTCMATNEPVLTNDLKIKWVDVDPDTNNISLTDLESKITENTKVILFVHWGGMPVNLDELNKICDRAEYKYGTRPLIIEDCAHSFLSTYNDKLIGTHGNYAVFSLQAIKQLTTGDGGLIFLPNKEEYERAKLLRWFGIDRDKRNYKRKDLRMENDVIDWGYKFHMNDINATIGIYNLPHIPDLIEKARINAKYYDQVLSELNIKYSGAIKLYNKYGNPSYWLYTIKIKDRDKFIEYMKDNNIMCSQVHRRNDVHTCFSKFKTSLPNLDKINEEIVCIPVGWYVTKEQCKNIVKLIDNFLYTIHQ